MAGARSGSRIFFLGAGFSRLAGLPLASELSQLVRDEIELRYGGETKYHTDLQRFLTYRRACNKPIHDETDVDLEEFMSYLDMEHFLRLRGRKTWSQEGNESQIMVRKAIGKVIHDRTPSGDALPNAYYRFAESLSAYDVVITLNYDILLERALEHIGRPYRLFPHRYEETGEFLDLDTEEITVLKLHGSVDWFDNRVFLEMQKILDRQGSGAKAKHSVFSDPSRFNASPIVDESRPDDDPLLHVHRIADVDGYYSSETDFHAPLILSPSHVKFVYAAPLLDFWHGLGRAGGWNLGVSVVGFSLPDHDEYMRMALYQVISNYQQSWWNEELLGQLKDYVRLVDYRKDEEGEAEYKERYSFVNSHRARFLFSGFNDNAVDFLFNKRRLS